MSRREIAALIQELKVLTVQLQRKLAQEEIEVVDSQVELEESSRPIAIGDRVQILNSRGIGRANEIGEVTRLTRNRISVRLDSTSRIAVRARRNVKKI